ncbi:hypothetical protein CLV28_1257 [Sediminihabitans luteus]|uniref:Uncharacterized protein n=1 Tax=Sediminihabitans luteus TaxID=1138585 RepID=A0A2M9CPF4_9CELL|nr:hypothetical protein CLV28_1257 [Sediminihabitans luteus]
MAAALSDLFKLLSAGAAIFPRGFADETRPLTLLEVSRPELAVAGVDVREEPGDPTDPASERYPHAFGPLPTSAVVTATPARMVDGSLVVDGDVLA